jgi:hypothetical protein
VAAAPANSRLDPEWTVGHLIQFNDRYPARLLWILSSERCREASSSDGRGFMVFGQQIWGPPFAGGLTTRVGQLHWSGALCLSGG